MALHVAVFGSDIRLEGVTISEKPSMIIGQPAGQPSIVISQRWYERAGIATLAENGVRENGVSVQILTEFISPYSSGMPRSLRLKFSGAFYHVMARGNRRETIFHDDDDRRFFLATLSEACAMTGWRVHAWVLMGNHYHLFIETPEANLVAGMSWLQNTVTRRHNVRHMAWGRLFGDRYKAVLVDGADMYHYRTLADYIHLNPVRARLVLPKKGQSVLDFPWSSLAGGWALPPGKRPKWLAAEEGLGRFDLPDTVAGRRRMVERLDRRAVEEEIKKCGMPVVAEQVDARCSHLRRGWYWGSQEFAEKLRLISEKLIKQKERSSRAYRKAPQVTAHSMEQAERWLTEGLEAAGLAAKDLPDLKGSDPRKLALAELLWRRTKVSQEWIAEKLSMRSAANVSQQLRRMKRGSAKVNLPPGLQLFLAGAWESGA